MNDLAPNQDGAMSAWARAGLALQLWALDPLHLGGIWVRARNGPARDAFLAALPDMPLPLRKIHPTIPDAQLSGGMDLAATLIEGRPVESPGILTAPALPVLTMAERCPPRLAARLGQACDRATHSVLALDEGAEPEEICPKALTERLAFFVYLEGVSMEELHALPIDTSDVAEARARLAEIAIDEDSITALSHLATALGIVSLRAPLLALAAARASAALFGRARITQEDIELAADLVYAHRAAPRQDAPEEAPDQEQAQDDRAQDDPDENKAQPSPDDLPEEMIVEAVRAALPPDLLAQLAAGRQVAPSAQAASGTGAAKRGMHRGRPLPSRPGRPQSNARIDLIATLRAAAPWQTLRRNALKGREFAPKVLIYGQDIRLKRYEERADRLLIFTVDASGSAAMARLAEAKGAVELLLAEAYARRDHVALVAFRGAGAEVLLPPTRSLVQAKRRLAGLPGGGGTPLAAGLMAAGQVSQQARARGMTPSLALLTDGRGNIGLDGQPGRAQAGQDATRVAQALCVEGLPALVIDTSVRVQPALRDLAGTLRANYVALPRANAQQMADVLSCALQA